MAYNSNTGEITAPVSIYDVQLNRGLMNRQNFQASHKNLQASRKNFQASRKNLQASHKKFFVSYCHLSYFQVNLLNNIDLFTNHTVIYCHILSCLPRFATGKVGVCYGQTIGLEAPNPRLGASKRQKSHKNSVEHDSI